MANLFSRLLNSRSLISGSVLYVGYRWFDRFLGLISLAILARLLAPESFGIVAMASIVVGLLDAVFNMGVHVLVLQKDNPDKEFLDNAWTLRILQASTISLLVAGLAPFAADYFSEPRVTSALYALALASFVGGLENFAIVEFQKARRFFREFQLSATKRLVMFFVVIGLAFVLESYWALILGTLLSRALGVVLAYSFHPVVHRVSFSMMGQLFHSGKWLLAMNVAAYIWNRIDEITVGRYFSSVSLGNYTVAAEVARLPTAELMAPISRALLPGFSSIKHDAEATCKLIYSSINTQASLALPAAAGLAICSGSIVQLFLGANWELAGKLLGILPLIFGAAALRYTGEYYLMAHERQKLLSYIVLYYIATFIGAVVYCRHSLGELDLNFVVYARAACDASGIVIIWLLTARESAGAVSVWGQIYQVIRPATATLCMCGVLLGFPYDIGNIGLDLAATIATGGVTYALVLVSVWWVSGRPDGFESWIYDRLRQKWQARTH